MFRRNGRARRCPSNSANPSERPRLSMELQGRQMRIVLGRSKRNAEADVHGAVERFAARPTGHNRTDESLSGPERPDQRCFVEFFGEEENQTVQTTAARFTRWHMADAASRHRSGSGIPEMHRMFSLPGCLPRASRPSDARQIYRAAFSDSDVGVKITFARGNSGSAGKSGAISFAQ